MCNLGLRGSEKSFPKSEVSANIVHNLVSTGLESRFWDMLPSICLLHEVLFPFLLFQRIGLSFCSYSMATTMRVCQNRSRTYPIHAYGKGKSLDKEVKLTGP